MARSWAVVLLAGTLLVGCQHQSGVVKNISNPSLNGPVVTAPAKPRPQPTPNSSSAAAKRKVPGVPDAWIPPVPANHWQWIVIHHSASPAGSAARFDREHREINHWDELGYHFVIGNGAGSGDGQIEVGPRWPKQKWGAHAKTADNRFNDFGIGICLVGDFDIDRPTPAQLRSLARLTAYLMETYHIPASRVIGHGDTKPTDCPGRNLSVAEVRRMASRLAGLDAPQDIAAAHPPQGELLHTTPLR